MVSSTAAIEALCKATGIPHVTMGHTARLLRQADDEFWPISGRGGGKSASHVEEWHLANMILTFGGAQPSDALKTVIKLGTATYAGRDPTTPIAATSVLYALSQPALDQLRDDNLRNRAVNLQEAIVLLIRRVAIAKAAGKKDSKLLNWARQKWWLLLSPGLNKAWTFATDEKGVEHSEYFDPPDHTLPQVLARGVPPALVERLVRIPFALIEVAAELWADTLAQRGQELFRVKAGASSDRAAPKSESTGGGDTPPAPTRNRPSSRQSQANNQPSFRQTGGRMAPPEPKARERETQANESPAAGRSLPKRGTRR